MLFWIVPYLDGAQKASPLTFVMQGPCPQMTSPDEVSFKQSAGVEVDTTSNVSVSTSVWKVLVIRLLTPFTLCLAGGRALPRPQRAWQGARRDAQPRLHRRSRRRERSHLRRLREPSTSSVLAPDRRIASLMPLPAASTPSRRGTAVRNRTITRFIQPGTNTGGPPSRASA